MDGYLHIHCDNMDTLKFGDYFLYQSDTLILKEKYWFVGKITSIRNDEYIYYSYVVIKNDGGSVTESLGRISAFAHGSVFHEDIIRMENIDDHDILAVLL